MRRVLKFFRYDYAGTIFALVFFCLSLTPSLLPRGWLLQGLISGVTAAIGYGVGLLIMLAVRKVRGRAHPSTVDPRAWRWLWIVAAVAVVVMAVLGAGWQQDIHRLMGLEPPTRVYALEVFGVAALMFVALVGIGRGLRLGARKLGALVGRWVPGWVARLTAVVVVTAVAFGFLNGVLIDGIFTATDNAFKQINSETDPGVNPTTDPNRSGGPGSLVSWASLGNQGRSFIAGGPTPEQLKAFGGAPPDAPIRVYVGLDSAPTPSERAALVVAELKRTGAFSRQLLCVIVTTGTGWVNELSTDPLEYMYGGDTALAGMQYSYLPSWISFLVDKERAREAGRELFNQVYDAWAALPQGQRPKLVVFGESLGSFGAESAFGGSEDMSLRTNGMLLVGPPNRNALWTEYVSHREPGTTQILPTYEQGTTVRFAGRPDDLDRPQAAWGPTRVVYLQHPSDPIVWWAPRLLLNRPDWLEEPRGSDVLPNMRWYPFVTFWQVTADMAFSTGVPPGHGHSYGAEGARAWARIIPPEGWTAEQTEKLANIIMATPE
jgi:uncharacterized membrane protein